MEYSWPGNIRELENLVKRYVIVGNESQIIRELSTHKPLISSLSGSASPIWEPKTERAAPGQLPSSEQSAAGFRRLSPSVPRSRCWRSDAVRPWRRSAKAIERVLNETRWNRRQAAKILKVSYKALLNKMKLMEEQDAD